MPYSSYCFLVPTSAPLNFTLTPFSVTSIKAEWKQIPSAHQNGNVSGYILFYKEKLLRAQPYDSIATDKLTVTLQGLKTFTEYSFRILAYNENGNGIATQETHVYTKESGILSFFNLFFISSKKGVLQSNEIKPMHVCIWGEKF